MYSQYTKGSPTSDVIVQIRKENIWKYSLVSDIKLNFMLKILEDIVRNLKVLSLT